METPNFRAWAQAVSNNTTIIDAITISLSRAFEEGRKQGYIEGTDFGWIDAQEQHYKDCEHE